MPPQGRNINYFEDDARHRAVSTPPIAPSIRPRASGCWSQAQQRIAELLPELPLYCVTKLDAVPTTLQGFTGNPTNTGVFWNVHEWEFGRITRSADMMRPSPVAWRGVPLLLVDLGWRCSR